MPINSNESFERNVITNEFNKSIVRIGLKLAKKYTSSQNKFQ